MKRKNILTACLLLLVCIYAQMADAQETKVRGTVRDALTNEPIPFVNLVFYGTNSGTITDFNGNYFIESRVVTDTLLISYLGYLPEKRAVTRNIFQEINVTLQPENIELDEISVVAPENPALAFFTKIIGNKKANDPRRVGNYSCEVYNKIEINITNIDESLKNKPIFKRFPIIFDYIDTSAVTGGTYLPVLISESLSDYFHRAKPKAAKEVIKASKISGIENESASQFTGSMYLSVPIYDNFIPILGKSFISPISNMGMTYYKYFLIDSAMHNGRWCYLLSFRPKSRQEPTFTGRMWIHDTTFAVASFEIRINENANINFVNDLVISHKYEYVNDSIWLLSIEKILADFNISERTQGVMGRKTTSYRNYELDINFSDRFFAGGTENIELADDAKDKDLEFWQQARHEELGEKEQGIYQMMDTITGMRAFRTYVEIVQLFMTGYKEYKYWELGPYFTMYSYNEIEGHRFRLGGRTTSGLSEKVRAGGYAAAGTRDKEVKYGGRLEWMQNKRPQRKAEISYKNDLEQLGQSPNALREDNILGSFFRRTPNNKLTGTEEFAAGWGQDIGYGAYISLSGKHRSLRPSEYVRFLELENGAYIDKQNIKTAEFTLGCRWAYNEKFFYTSFERTSMGTSAPVLSAAATLGLRDPASEPKPYYKAYFEIEHRVKTNPIGYIDYMAGYGKIWGTLPYPLLELHRGNETYTYDDYSYNLMNYYEFFSDHFVSGAFTHHFDGFFFNKVPLFKRLKLREVVSGKAVMGWASDDNIRQSQLPGFLSPLGSPYAEGGVGIENIFRLIRLDAIWRLTHLDNPGIARFGLRMKIQFNF
jgi:hypothetical protein